MKIVALGRLAGIRTAINNDTLVTLRRMPGVTKWRGNMLMFEPTRESIQFVQANFPKAEWDAEAKRFIEIIDNIERNTLKLPSNVPQDYFVYKTKPYEHQDKLFHLQKNEAYFAFLMEQGTGKTKSALDLAAYLWSKGKIQGMLVVAFPNGVHQNWLNVEVPTHLPDWCEHIGVVWNPQRGERALDKLYQMSFEDTALRILTVNVEALSTKRGEEVCRKFLSSFPSLFVVDESTSIKKMAAKRSKAIIRLGLYAPYRRILTGTAASGGPLNLYSQYLFLDEAILGFGSFYAFRNRYAVMRPLPNKFARSGRKIEIVVGYQHTEELQEKIKPYTFRVLKKDCLDLPEKVYKRLPVELSDEQQRLYDQFTEEVVAEFRGRQIPAALAITRMLRLHQVVCGFMPPPPGMSPEDAMGEPIDEKNPRLQSLLDYLDTVVSYDSDTKQFHNNEKVIIWATYRYNIKEILEALEDKYGKGRTAPISGNTPQKFRPGIIEAFQDPTNPLAFLVANKAAAYGYTLTQAKTAIYYSNSFDLEVRLQSEDRQHRIGQRNNVTYVDIEATGTIDTTIIDRLRNKYEMCSMILGDQITDWLNGSANLEFFADQPV